MFLLHVFVINAQTKEHRDVKKNGHNNKIPAQGNNFVQDFALLPLDQYSILHEIQLANI